MEVELTENQHLYQRRENNDKNELVQFLLVKLGADLRPLVVLGGSSIIASLLASGFAGPCGGVDRHVVCGLSFPFRALADGCSKGSIRMLLDYIQQGIPLISPGNHEGQSPPSASYLTRFFSYSTMGKVAFSMMGVALTGYLFNGISSSVCGIGNDIIWCNPPFIVGPLAELFANGALAVQVIDILTDVATAAASAVTHDVGQ